jgi:hypothetical protein
MAPMATSGYRRTWQNHLPKRCTQRDCPNFDIPFRHSDLITCGLLINLPRVRGSQRRAVVCPARCERFLDLVDQERVTEDRLRSASARSTKVSVVETRLSAGDSGNDRFRRYSAISIRRGKGEAVNQS